MGGLALSQMPVAQYPTIARPTGTIAASYPGASADTVESFAAGDPYVRAGLVKRWHVRKWTTVVGDAASNPVRPQAG